MRLRKLIGCFRLQLYNSTLRVAPLELLLFVAAKCVALRSRLVPATRRSNWHFFTSPALTPSDRRLDIRLLCTGCVTERLGHVHPGQATRG